MVSFKLIEKSYLPPAPIITKISNNLKICSTSSEKYVAYGTINGVCLRAIPDTLQSNPCNLRMYNGCSAPILNSFVSKDNEYVVGTDVSRKVYVWQHNDKNVTLNIYEFGLESLEISDIKICSETGQVAIVGISDNTKYHGVCFGVKDGKRLSRFLGHVGGICSVSMRNKKPNMIATAGIDGCVCLRTGINCNLESSIKGHEGRATCIQFSPCGNFLGSCGDDGNFNLWCLSNGEVDRVISISSSPLLGFSWSADSTKISTICADYSIQIVNVINGMVISSCFLESFQPELPISIDWTVNDWIIMATQSGLLWGLKTYDQSKIEEHLFFVWQGLQGKPTAIAPMMDLSGGMVAGDNFGNITTIITKNGNLCCNYCLKSPEPAAVVSIVTGMNHGAAIFDNCAIGVFTLKPKNFTFNILSKRKSFTNSKTDMKLAFKNSSDYLTFQHIQHEVNNMLFTPDCNVVQSDTMSAPWVSYTKTEERPVDVKAIDRGKSIMVFFKSGKIKTYPFENSTQCMSFDVKGSIVTTSASLDGELIAIVIKANAGYPVERLHSREPTINLNNAHIIEFYDTNDVLDNSLKFLSAYQLTNSEITCIALNFKGTMIAVADKMNKIYVVDIQTGRLLINSQWDLHKTQIISLKWSPEGKYLSSVSEDRTIFLWNLNDIDNPVSLECSILENITLLEFPLENFLIVGGSNGLLVCYDLVNKTDNPYVN